MSGFKYYITVCEKDGTSCQTVISNCDLEYAKEQANVACKILNRPCWEIRDYNLIILSKGVRT